MKIFAVFFTLFFTILFYAQQPASKAEALKEALANRTLLDKSSSVKNIPFKNVGPTIMSGRVVDLAVNPEDPTQFYVAYASGGLWFTKNNGTSFKPVMDNAPTQNIGDIAVHWKSNTIWVGTGENNSSRSSYAGIGMLKSVDGGSSWQHMGLEDSHHIGRILINPENPDEVIVGVTGHLYSPNQERGIYKTVDGGKHWEKTLFINDQTGIIDVAHVPGNFNILYAAAWEKDRKAWNFKGNGDDSGIYKSIDTGKSWHKISGGKSGFPEGDGVGRIGLAVFSENLVYAVLDNQFHRKKDQKKETSDALTKDQFKNMTVVQFLNLDNKKLNTYLKANGFQEKYKAENVKQLVQSGSVKPEDLAKYLEDANAMLFDTPVIGAQVYRTEDGGSNWKKTHEGYLDDLYYSYGYYFGHIYVSPHDKNHIYIYGVPILKSKDGGKTFVSMNAKNVHVDHHALWINPNNPEHLIDGNDGGVNITYDDGETWIKNNTPAVGQFYAINIDHASPYNIYGGLQDNGVWVGAHNAKEDRAWHQKGKYPWESILGGDGMQIQIDRRDHQIVYTGFQFGNYYRINRKSNQYTPIQPRHELGETPYRFNWQTPILLSSHNQDILYLGGNKLHRSMNKGDTWVPISNDLTSGGKKGNVAYGTLTTLSESPFEFGLIYTGSDDGYVYVTKNGGGNWKRISDTFPKDLWVSRVIASAHKKERVYVTLNGYRWDDFKPYVYVSDDYGNQWRELHGNLPLSPVNVIREDPENENILYLGTDNGVYISFNQGASWEVFMKGLPKVAVHDLVIHPTAAELVVGTHGRSIYTADVKFLQKFTPDIQAKALHLFELADVPFSKRWGSSRNAWSDTSTPEMSFIFYTKGKAKYTVEIQSEKGVVLNRFDMQADPGFNFGTYHLRVSEKGRALYEKKHKASLLKKAKDGFYYLPKGAYSLIISSGKISEKQSFKIE